MHTFTGWIYRMAANGNILVSSKQFATHASARKFGRKDPLITKITKIIEDGNSIGEIYESVVYESVV